MDILGNVLCFYVGQKRKTKDIEDSIIPSRLFISFLIR